jgi:hypothetical protein
MGSPDMSMTRKINAVTARTQFGRVMDRAVDHNERFLIERNGEPAILILTVADFVRTPGIIPSGTAPTDSSWKTPTPRLPRHAVSGDNATCDPAHDSPGP